jgi:hypothetical protein
MDETNELQAAEHTTPPSIQEGRISIPMDRELTHGEIALGFIESHGGFTDTKEQAKAVPRKIDVHLMPLVCSNIYSQPTFS